MLQLWFHYSTVGCKHSIQDIKGAERIEVFQWFGTKNLLSFSSFVNINFEDKNVSKGIIKKAKNWVCTLWESRASATRSKASAESRSLCFPVLEVTVLRHTTACQSPELPPPSPLQLNTVCSVWVEKRHLLASPLHSHIHEGGKERGREVSRNVISQQCMAITTSCLCILFTVARQVTPGITPHLVR